MASAGTPELQYQINNPNILTQMNKYFDEIILTSSGSL